MLAVLYLLFNEGYAASSGTELIRAEFCRARRSASRGLLHQADARPLSPR